MMTETNGTTHVEISRAANNRLRVTLTVGSFDEPDSPTVPPYEPEGVEISVLVDSQANPRLLNVQLAALGRARELISDQMKALREAIQTIEEDDT